MFKCARCFRNFITGRRRCSLCGVDLCSNCKPYELCAACTSTYKLSDQIYAGEKA